MNSGTLAPPKKNMKIIIDLGHPAHVHYFKNFIQAMQKKGHDFLITARNRGEIFDLLRSYNLNYFDRGTGSDTQFGKILYLPKADYLLYRLSKKFKPDLFLSFGSIYAAHASKLYRKPHIAFDDTEHSKLEHILYVPFTDLILTPSCFRKDFGQKHVRFNGYMELCYLHPTYFTPDPAILSLLGVRNGEKYIIMRFVSWGASHDTRHTGLSLEMKRKAVKILSNYAKVFISAEGQLPEDLKQYQIRISPEWMHDALYYASLFFGESGTMTTEAALLGTPAVCVSTLSKLIGNHLELRDKYGLLFFYDSGNEGIEMALRLFKKDLKSEWKIRRERMLKDKINVTAFIVSFIENYPKSLRIMKEIPDYQWNSE